MLMFACKLVLIFYVVNDWCGLFVTNNSASNIVTLIFYLLYTYSQAFAILAINSSRDIRILRLPW